MQKIHLKRTKRINGGHLWVFSNEIYESTRGYAPGSLVELFDRHESFLGTGYINPNSLISVRVLSRERAEINRDFFVRRMREAFDLRKRLFEGRDALRLIYSEGDYLPGLIADRYGKCIVLQFLTYGVESFKDMIIELVDEILAPDVIVLKNESRSRAIEGLQLYKELIKGSLDRLPVIEENGLSIEIDPFGGQKTGYFLDQKDNRRALRQYLKGGKGLDLFCYSGAWSLAAAMWGAEVTGVDESERAIGQAKKNAAMNALQGRAAFVRDDVFSFLRRSVADNREKYDFIVLDPPAFVKSSAKMKEAVKAYREVNRLSMGLLKRGGLLVTSSCSYHLGREMFLEMLREASKDAQRGLRLLELRSQDRDHPVLLAMPETEYLKCAFLVVD